MDYEMEQPVTGIEEVLAADEPVVQTITVDNVREWEHTRQKYKAGKKHLEQRIIDAEQIWKLRHWEQIRKKDTGDPEPASAWLVNMILGKHSDACDNYPRPVCLPREETDQQQAKELSDIIPVILAQNHFDQTWSDIWWYKLKTGTAVYGTFWDPEALAGLGDVTIQKIDILNLFWEPGVADIQDSRYLFHVKLIDNVTLEEDYPELKGKLKQGSATLAKYHYDDSIDTSDKSEVVDVYYKRKVDGRSILHFAKYCNETLLYATENDTEGQYSGVDPMTGQPMMVKAPPSETGLYQHGMYPFVFDALFPEEGYPNCGFGYVDLCKDPQKYIDLMDNALIKNMLSTATPRWFVRSDGGVNEEEYADLTKSFVHVQGRIGEDSIVPITNPGMSSIYVEQKQLKIDEMKQVAGNRDVNRGGAAGITAASAIVALQEAGNGLSRDMIANSYRAVAKVIDIVIELIREFYDVPRKFRITGQNGDMQFVSFDNSGIMEQAQGNDFGVDLGYRKPVFDIDVEVEKDNQYKTQQYNDLAIQLYQLGAFNPQAADQVLPMIDMMDFKGKDEVRKKIAENAKLQKYMTIALDLASRYDPLLFQQMLQDLNIDPTGGNGGMASPKMPGTGHVGLPEDQTNAYLDRTRASASAGTSPR